MSPLRQSDQARHARGTTETILQLDGCQPLYLAVSSSSEQFSIL